MDQTNEQQRHFSNEWPISDLHAEVDFIQTSLKPHVLYIPKKLWIVSVF
jgi:hypothetical protein